MGISRRGGGLRVIVDGEIAVERRSPPTRRTLLRREELDLAPYMGQVIALEIFDDDPKGQIFLDDLRLTAR